MISPRAFCTLKILPDKKLLSVLKLTVFIEINFLRARTKTVNLISLKLKNYLISKQTKSLMWIKTFLISYLSHLMTFNVI